MSLTDLTERQREIVHRCLRVAADEPSVFPDWEFQTLFGLTRPEVLVMADQWPSLDETSEDVSIAIDNAMNNLIGYPHGLHKDWSSHFDFSTDELVAALAKWRGSPPTSYFEGMR